VGGISEKKGEVLNGVWTLLDLPTLFRYAVTLEKLDVRWIDHPHCHRAFICPHAHKQRDLRNPLKRQDQLLYGVGVVGGVVVGFVVVFFENSIFKKIMRLGIVVVGILAHANAITSGETPPKCKTL
jgi:hypothetical protein